MADDHANDAEEVEGSSSDRSLEERPGDLRRTSPRSDGERPESMGPDRQVPPRSDGQLQHGEALDAEFADEVSARVTHDLVGITRSAPLPEPRELAQYEQIQPGLANRMVQMAEGSADAANTATKSNAEVNNAIASSIREDGKSVQRGQWMFTVLAVLFLAAAVTLALIGNTAFAITMGILGFLSGFGVLVRPVNNSRWRPETKDDQEE